MKMNDFDVNIDMPVNIQADDWVLCIEAKIKPNNIHFDLIWLCQVRAKLLSSNNFINKNFNGN